MKVEPFFNQGIATLEREFQDSVAWATEVELASAFITPDGLRRLEAVLRNPNSPLIRILTGLYQQFTSPEVIAGLLRLQRQHSGRLFARIAKNQRFHWKYFCFRKSSAVRAYVGSANLTRDGLTASGEIFVRLKGRLGESAILSLREGFEEVWTRHASRITPELIKAYKSGYQAPRVKSPADDLLAKFLEKPERTPLAADLIPKPRLIFVSDKVSEDTAQSIRRETEWDRRGLDYIVFPDKSSYEKARDAGVLLNVSALDSDTNYRVEFRRVEEYSDSIETADGKYFVAHSKLPRSWSRNLSKIKAELRPLGLTKKKLESDRYLNRKQRLGLARLLHAESLK